MRKEHWEILRKAARREPLPGTPAAFIVDSPWIPGYLGISAIDYITLPDVWFGANMEVMKRFPDAIMLPGFWAEPGMAAEPSGYGCRMSFADDGPPSVHPVIRDVSEADGLKPPDPRRDGLMPLVLAQYRNALRPVREAGMDIKIVAGRGPLAIAAHILGVTEFLVGLKTEPEKTHKLLAMTTQTVKDWLEAQAEVLPGAEGFMVLDDVTGFLSREDYLEFAYPYMKDIFSTPAEVRILHNDTDNPSSYEFLAEMGVDIFNFTHLKKISTVRALTGPKVCLMGNVPPLDLLVNGGAEECRLAALDCIRENAGHPGFILSAGGGVSPGTKGENIAALLEAARG